MTISVSKDNPREATEFRPKRKPVSIRGILAATDFSDQATLALKIAARLAKQFRSRLHVLYVSSPQAYELGVSTLVTTLQQVDMTAARKQLHEYAATISQVRTAKHEEIVSCGLVAETIYETAERKGIQGRRLRTCLFITW